MITGIIYKYTSPSGKSYIGQTTNEAYRRRMWFNNGRYTGGRSKIDRARKKYGVNNFVYEILFKKDYATIEIATEELNKLESYFIGLFDTYRHGYNSTLGGDGTRGYKLDELAKNKISFATKGKKKSKEFSNKMSAIHKGRPMSEAAKKKLSNSKKNNGNKIVQYDLQGNYIRTWDNIDIVSKTFNVSRESIAGCCRGKSKSAHGFIWKYSQTGEPVLVLPKPRRADARHVYQLNMNGVIIREFNSIVEASKFVGCASSNISACCRNKINSIKGYKWKYKNGNL